VDLPERLVDDLIAIYTDPCDVPPAIDLAILARAREQLAARRPERIGFLGRLQPLIRRPLIRRPLIAAAATASLIIALWGGLELRRPPLTPGDLDANGRVDIADAFHLARLLAADSSPKAEWDVNQDGLIGQADVESIAEAAVSLSRSQQP
jgi:hypothetical protein